jgi:hypothetical protein
MTSVIEASQRSIVSDIFNTLKKNQLQRSMERRQGWELNSPADRKYRATIGNVNFG